MPADAITKEAGQGTTKGPSAPVVQLRRFRPSLTLGYQQDLLALAADISPWTLVAQRELIQEAIGRVEMRRVDLLSLGVAPSELLPTVAYIAALRLLRDLVSQGWHVGTDDEGIYLAPPAATYADTSSPAAKEALRESFAFARNAQLAEKSTAKFIRDMERRGVGRLFADGDELARRLREGSNRGDLAFAMRPSLHLVTPEAKDEETGLRLQDVWRYARHYWSIPYQSTPGRNMFYLVRDEAGQGSPIVGIAALGNAVLGLAQRDDALLWTSKALRLRLPAMSTKERRTMARHLVAVVHEGMNEVFSDDLWPDGLTEWERVVWLEEVERQASFQRKAELADAGDARTDEYHFIREIHNLVEDGREEEVDWTKVAKTNLYRRKRAGTLSGLLRTSLVFDRWRLADDPDQLEAMLNDDDGCRAVEVALRRIKQTSVAENLMEIITCGAVPPYGDVLGGKLVSMLLTSPKVVKDFRSRYQGRVSLIASAMKGASVRRSPKLAYLSTSSLYSVGSSQYNRIKVPGSLLNGEGSVVFQRLGITESFGTVHFSPDTATTLVDVARLANEGRRFVNHLFGEGKSPKLRALRTGLEAIGLSSDTFLRHHSPRLLYGIALCHNSDDVLLGLSSRPSYVLKGKEDGVDEIADYWRDRWLRPRIERDDVMTRLEALPRAQFLLSKQIPAQAERSVSVGGHAPTSDVEPVPVQFSAEAISFVERLYRSANSYADRLNEDELSWIHIDLGLEGFLLEQARAAKQIVVTGNPGDGKTHLIERLRKQLEEECGALVLTDANALKDDDVLVAWRQCAKEGRPFVLAINEWPLFVLKRLVRSDPFPAVDEALRQVQQAVYFTPPAPLPAAENVVVIDLSLRNILSEDVLRIAIERLTQERFYGDLHSADPALENRRALMESRVQDRLVRLLARVAHRSGHATMRQLMGFIAFIITGGRSAPERLASQGSARFHYANLIFEGGVGLLFDHTRSAFDPATVTHPVHDAALWRGMTSEDDWLFADAASIGPQQMPERERDAAYRGLKRRFFFEHVAGDELLALIPSDETRFEALVEEGEVGSPTLVRELLLSVNRFYEPDCAESDRDRLHLWQSHRFDVRAPETFVALHHLEHQHFQIAPPKFAPWVEEWLPKDQRLARSFSLTASSGATSAQILVDRELYLTLKEAERGLSRSSWSRSSTRKVTRFVDRLHQLTDLSLQVADIRIRNTETDLDKKFEIQREPVARYLL